MIRGTAAHRFASFIRITRVSVADRAALGALVALPVLLILPWSLAGHPIVPGDDLTQNYPLRVLTGDLIRSGHLPSWDPFIWSGTPLLAGWNAGALYPATWLFAVLPGVAAWTANLIAVGVVCGTGLYLLLRRLGCGALAAAIGAVCFSETGFMSAQNVHLGLVEGTGMLPWTLLAVEMIATSPTVRSRVGAVVLLGISVSLCVLAGEPRAISSEAIVLVIYVVVRATNSPAGRRLWVVAGSVVGIAVASGVSAIQWVPGLSFVSSSQRGLGAYTAFGSGSLDWKTIGHYLLLPFLVGGNGNFGLPLYRGGYNIPEEAIGVGLLPLCAALAYLPELFARPLSAVRALAGRAAGTLAPETRRPRLGVWYVIGLVGLILTLGTTTPIGNVLARVPLYGGERLQNRNAVMFDFALAVLVGFFVNDVVNWNRARRMEGRRFGPLSSWVRRLLAVAPPIVVFAIIAAAYLHPKGLQAHLGVARPLANFFDEQTPYLAAAAVVAAAAGIFVLVAARLSPRMRTVVLVPLACADIGLFVANASYAGVPSAELAGPTAESQTLSALVGPSGRFAIYNPLVNFVPSTSGFAGLAGETDLNILRSISSVQGYSSIVGGAYQDATNTHDYESLNPSGLADGLFDSLDLRALLTTSTYLDERIPAKSAIPVAGGTAVTETGAERPAHAAPSPGLLASGPWNIGSLGEAQWLLPSVTEVEQVTVVVNATNGQRPSRIEIGVAGQSRLATVAVTNGVATASFPAVAKTEAVLVRNPTPQSAVIGAVVASTRDPERRLLLDGSLQGSLALAHWSYAGLFGPFSVFVNDDHLVAPAWLQPLDSRAPDVSDRVAGVVTVVPTKAATEPMVVSASKPSLLVRSETYQSGWSARLTPVGGGATRTVEVSRIGLVQAISVPKGDFSVTWDYAPKAVLVGTVLTLGTLAALVALGVVTALPSWRRRRRRGLAESDPSRPKAG